MAITTKETYYCTKCNKVMQEKQFYGSNNLEKYPEGKLDVCKNCLTMHVDNWEPDTYMWILQEIDIPYIPEEWHKLLESYANQPEKLTGMTILGKYISKMKLKQWKDYRFKDTEFLQELADAKLEQAMKRQGFGAAEIAQAKIDSRNVPEDIIKPEIKQTDTQPSGGWMAGPPDDHDFDVDLTDEDTLYLKLKWGRAYRPDEWVRLEQLYNDMLASYDVQGAGHEDTLKLVCKTSLKANQLIDLGDVEGFQKMSKVYDSLMKSGNFTANQNKQKESEGMDAIGQLVAMCETEGFIPRYYVDKPQDKVDATIADLKGYTKQLVYDELNLGNLIEQSLKVMMAEENKKEDDEDDDADIEREIFADEPAGIADSAYEEHSDFLQDEIDKDVEYMNSLLEGGRL